MYCSICTTYLFTGFVWKPALAQTHKDNKDFNNKTTKKK